MLFAKASFSDVTWHDSTLNQYHVQSQRLTALDAGFLMTRAAYRAVSVHN